MSIEANYYLISGYDLTGMETNKFDDWRYTEDAENYFCYQYKDHIQLFDDPMNRDYLYLGYIHFNCNQYDDHETNKFYLEDLDRQEDVDFTLEYLKSIGVIEYNTKPIFKVISFVEYT